MTNESNMHYVPTGLKYLVLVPAYQVSELTSRFFLAYMLFAITSSKNRLHQNCKLVAEILRKCAKNEDVDNKLHVFYTCTKSMVFSVRLS